MSTDGTGARRRTLAVIDVGTNSTKMRVGRMANGELVVVEDALVVTRLGEGLHVAGRLGEDAMARTARTIATFAARARELGAAEVVAVGTLAMRRAANAAELVERVARDCGVTIEILPGEEEARLSYGGAVAGLVRPGEAVQAFDAGGGSTEIVFGEGATIRRRTSVEIGSRRPTEELLRSDPVRTAEVAAVAKWCDEALAGVEPGTGRVVGIGGTVTTLAAVRRGTATYDAAGIHGSRLSRADVAAMGELFRPRTIAERRGIPGLMPERADVILAGAILVEAVLRRLGAEELTVSAHGLRQGVLMDRLAGQGAAGPGAGEETE